MESKGTSGGLLQPGGKFGLYDVLRLLGRGGMGEVYLLRSPRDGELYAAKIMFPPPGAVEGREAYEWRRRFANEAIFAMKVTHRNLIRVYDAGEDPDSHLCYIIMDYMPGGTLSDRIRAKGRLAIDEAVKIAVKVATALEVAHRAGIVHRDIKPDNIMFDDGGEPRLADLGIAKFSKADSSMSMTKTEMIVGTPSYMAPEQMMDSHNVDARADIYSLGIVLYEMLTGSRPREGSTVIELLAKAVKGEELPSVCTMRPEVSATIGYALSRLTASKPDVRPSTALDAAKLLHDAYMGKLNVPRKMLMPSNAIASGGGDKQTIAKALVFLAVCALLGSGIIAIATLFSGRHSQPTERYKQDKPVEQQSVVVITNEVSKTLYKTVVVTNVVEGAHGDANSKTRRGAAATPSSPTPPKAVSSPRDGKTLVAHENDFDWHYRIVGDGVELVCAEDRALLSVPGIVGKPKGCLIIPAKLNGRKVKGIGRFAFNKCDAITSVSVPDGVEYIGFSAFNACTSLRRVRLPATVSDFASAFSRCTKLEAFDIDWYNQHFKVEKGLVYSKDKKTFVKFPPACRVKSVTFPVEMHKIGDYAFSDCTMGSFAVPKTIREIGKGAFARCSHMETISFAGNIDAIGSYAFGCSGLKSISIPNGVKEIVGETFRDCAALETIRFPATLSRIGGHAIFEGCKSLHRIEFMGNAPTLFGAFQLFPEDFACHVNVYVRHLSKGWKSEGVTGLPDKWPVGARDARPIYYMKER